MYIHECMSGSMDVWTHGCMDALAYGYMDILIK